MWDVFVETLHGCVVVLAFFAFWAYGLALVVSGGKVRGPAFGWARLGAFGGSAVWAVWSALLLSGKAAMTLASGVRMAAFLTFAAVIAAMAWWVERRLIERRARRLRAPLRARGDGGGGHH